MAACEQYHLIADASGSEIGYALLRRLDHPEQDVAHVHSGDFHVRQLELDELELPDLLAPQLALLGVVDAQPQAFLDDTQRHGRDADPLGGEIRPRAGASVACLIVLGFAEQPVTAQPNVVEEQFAGA